MAAHKFLKNSAGVITEEAGVASSAGAGDDGKLVALDAAGKIDISMLPLSVGVDTISVLTSEALAAGNLVNIYSNAGTANARKADATTDKPAHGFVVAAFGSGVSALIYTEGTNTSVSGLTVGPQWLSTTAGAPAATAPSGSGNIVQQVGVANTATSLVFRPMQRIVLV